MGALESYIDAWRRHDVEAIGSWVTESCRVVECYGPMYVGRARVEQWATAWFGSGGVVHGWTITDRFATADRDAAEWTFDYTWRGSRLQLHGCSIATIQMDKIALLHEYRNESDTYEWAGAWCY